MTPDLAPIAVSGARGFIGANLVVRLREAGRTVRTIDRDTAAGERAAILAECGVLFHLAGANRPGDPAEFDRVNRALTEEIAAQVAAGGRQPLVLFSSSAKAAGDSAYGQSKRAAEQALLDMAARGQARVLVYRLPNVFGKWARPDYNSAVATFAHRLARGEPIVIDDPAAPLDLLYIDDLIDQWLAAIERPPETGLVAIETVHHTQVGAVAQILQRLAEGRAQGAVGAVGGGLERALYATLVAALPEESFAYPLTPHRDARGSFTEMLRTRDSGQVAVLTAPPGVTRGGHYHHSKVEKFLVVHGAARFRFRDLRSGRTLGIDTDAARPMVVETIPGWSHDITNVGDGPLVAMVWASEPFDPGRPDTVASAP